MALEKMINNTAYEKIVSGLAFVVLGIIGFIFRNSMAKMHNNIASKLGFGEDLRKHYRLDTLGAVLVIVSGLALIVLGTMELY